MNKKILQLAIPNIISNITVPLLGMIDMAIVGHLDSESYIGAIAVAATIFNFIYWNFGFLRMGTSGFTAQSYGARDLREAVNILVRAMTVGLSIALLILLLQSPIQWLAFKFIKASDTVQLYARQYIGIYIWAAPAVLGLYSLKGWFIGMQNSRTPMFVAITINILNIALSLFFVFVLEMKVKGVALGSLLAQYIGFITAAAIWFWKYGKLRKYIDFRKAIDFRSMIAFFKVNSDIFLRTLCLIAVFTFFTAASAKMGDTLLAVNTLLLQLFTLFSYIMDGFAYAGEALTGRYIGANSRPLLKQSIRGLFRWGFILTLVFTLLYAFWGESILYLLTDKENIINEASNYFYWVLAVPIAGFSAFLWDGILIGATASAAMRNAMFLATVAFFILYYSLEPMMGNNALWLAFII
ncbi:MATE family efflux transporter, partial [Bacteroidales bacterium OttesenSCG-928-C19]|nr:MATE family efflux transporter [Bacteroidales bacterium OttesenSCG-928-C19]